MFWGGYVATIKSRRWKALGANYPLVRKILEGVGGHGVVWGRRNEESHFASWRPGTQGVAYLHIDYSKSGGTFIPTPKSEMRTNTA